MAWHTIAAGLGCIGLAYSVFAQEPPVYTGSETVVTAGRVAQKLSDTLHAVTIINARDIAESGQQSLVEVLQTLGGVEITSNGGAGTFSSVFIRGANASHTLVLVDGLRIGSATAGTTAFENIPVEQIERIEIVAGPSSGLYGSDAVGGVIQIFTKSGRYSPGISVSAGIGSYNARSLSAALSRSIDDTDFTLSAGYLDTNSFSATRPTVAFGQFNPDDDGYRNSNFSAKLAHHFNPLNELGATALYSKGSAHFDNGLTSDDVTRQTLSAYSVYSRNQITSAWQSLLRLGNGRDDNVSAGSFPGAFRTDQKQATWQNTFTLAETTVIAGYEYLKQEVMSDTRFAVTQRTINSVFGGFSGDYGNHGVQANVRRDDNSQFGTPTTGSVGYGYRLTPAIKLRAGYGTAFHAPTFNDLYFPTDPFFGGGGNPDLKPERSRNREIGVDCQSGKQRFAATYFDNRIANLIALDAMFSPRNIGAATIRGTELSYQGNIFATQLRAKLTVQDPADDNTGLQLQRRAKQFGSISAAHAWAAWKIGAELVASGQRFDSTNEAPTSRLAGYALINFFVTRRLAPEWLVEARWNNVTDKDYERVQGYNTPRSNVFVSLRWTPATR